MWRWSFFKAGMFLFFFFSSRLFRMQCRAAVDKLWPTTGSPNVLLSLSWQKHWVDPTEVASSSSCKLTWRNLSDALPVAFLIDSVTVKSHQLTGWLVDKFSWTSARAYHSSNVKIDNSPAPMWRRQVRKLRRSAEWSQRNHRPTVSCSQCRWRPAA